MELTKQEKAKIRKIRFLERHPNYKQVRKQVYNPENCRNWYLKNKDRKKEVRNLWILNNLEEHRLRLRIRKHNREAIGKINKEEWMSKLKFLGNKCMHCLKSGIEIKLTIDHIVPISKGGTNDTKNLQPLCLSCNSRKGNRDNRGYTTAQKVALLTGIVPQGAF